MPGKVKVKILAGRNLPIMDRGSLTTDAYVEVKLGNVCHKTEVARKTLNPQWNSDWYRFEVDDAELQDEPLQIRIMDYDTYSANDVIGKVYLSLNPLLLTGSLEHNVKKNAKGTVMSGWLPVFDTLQGIRGEINLIVKVDLFSDVNKFRQSSCGVNFFCSSCTPVGYSLQVIHGFVEELIVNDDPEYQWIDKIRTPRASNEARQAAFLKLSGQVQRKIGLKAIEMGANSVIAYKLSFDLENDIGVVARGTGTAVTIKKIQEYSQIFHADNTLPEEIELQSTPFRQRTESINARLHQISSTSSTNTGRETPNLITHHRRSSDSDLSITPKGNSLNSGDKLNSAIPKNPVSRPTVIQDNLDMLEYPFLTMSKFPPNFILHLGATVAARSVKLLERIPNPDEPETRDSWWKELRMEIRSHARAIGCNIVLGYCETTTITDDVCVLNATGTAAIVNFNNVDESFVENLVTSKKDGSSIEKRETIAEKDFSDSEIDINTKEEHIMNPNIALSPGIAVHHQCSICHVPYTLNSVPLKTNLSKCTICKRGKVPDVMLATIEIPESIPVTGRACLIQAHVCRYKRDLKSEVNAKEISDGLPFLEYELHRQLICKLKVKGMNAIFGLKVSLAVGERLIAMVATGTAVFLSCLPVPKVPKIIAGNSWTDSAKLDELQKTVQETQERNKHIFQTKIYTESESKLNIDEADNDDVKVLVDLTLGNKDSCILEVDDIQDLALVSLIMECNPPDGIHVVNTDYIPGLQELEAAKHLQMFSQVWRAKIPSNQLNSGFSKHFQKLLQTIYFKLRTMIPCIIVGLKFLIELPEADEIQILVTGMAYNFYDSCKSKYKKRVVPHSISKDGVRRLDDDLIFNLEEDIDENEQQPNVVHTGSIRLRKTSPVKTKSKIARHFPLKERYGVDITPLATLPGLQVEKYLGNLNFFFIRESTSIRESGGISGFVHSFITEILAIVRAHVSCLGGNGIVSFYMTELMLLDNQNKNQVCCIFIQGKISVIFF
ncbi:C2 domain-containing protein 5 isoform X3 [Culicoides brevitarsis]|uniref:C2 domain-containing protein 5 isoform X3 n=1 Tax=Culicoides brevitarsis TaxID=469753 RepID=UPI00307B9D14